MKHHPSAWEKVEGENANISYWKWRVRHMENIAFIGFVGGVIIGGILMAFVVGALM